MSKRREGVREDRSIPGGTVVENGLEGLLELH